MTEEIIQEFREYLEKEKRYTFLTIMNYLQGARRFLEFLQERGYKIIKEND